MKDVDVRSAPIAAFFSFLALKIIVEMKPGSDWLPLWIAGRAALTDPAILYDFHRITLLQPEIYRDSPLRPFIYPPSALILIVPLAQLPFWASLALLAGASLAGVVTGARKVGADPLLLATAPPLMLAAVVGQMSLLVVALVMAACLLIKKDERSSGALLAFAALIKPTLLILTPVGLIAGRHWSALLWAGVTIISGIAASVLLFGLQLWLDWFDALPRFQQMFADYSPLVRNAISPYALAVRLGVEHAVVIIALAIPAIVITWRTFSRPSDPATMVAMMLGGTLLMAPYAMYYELAVFGPALLALPRDRLLNVAIVAVWGASLFLNAGIIGLAVAYAAIAYPIVKGSKRHSSGLRKEPLME
ncbi:MAG TPA: glycosyltransferase family 87 protein [Sphingomicrobium sp.]